MKVLNLTQHKATPEQVAAGVVEPEHKKLTQDELTFISIPTAADIERRAWTLSVIAYESGCDKAMIGGAPFLMAALERALCRFGIEPLYAFSVRDSVEEDDGAGGIRKTNIFRHAGFIPAIKGVY